MIYVAKENYKAGTWHYLDESIKEDSIYKIIKENRIFYTLEISKYEIERKYFIIGRNQLKKYFIPIDDDFDDGIEIITDYSADK
jgi:hypothetical protein